MEECNAYPEPDTLRVRNDQSQRQPNRDEYFLAYTREIPADQIERYPNGQQAISWEDPK